jgi:Lar family restriction alleviation protein
VTEELKPCPFCGGSPSTVERPDNIDGTEFFYAVACYCGGYSACAHKMARRKTPEQAKADATAAWNTRAAASLADTGEVK